MFELSFFIIIAIRIFLMHWALHQCVSPYCILGVKAWYLLLFWERTLIILKLFHLLLLKCNFARLLFLFFLHSCYRGIDVHGCWLALFFEWYTDHNIWKFCSLRIMQNLVKRDAVYLIFSNADIIDILSLLNSLQC